MRLSKKFRLVGDSMKYVDLLELFREKLKSKCADDHYAALLFALQLPSICGRMEFPKTEKNTGNNGKNSDILYRKNGNPWDKNLYFAWLKNHKNWFIPWSYSSMPFDVLCENIYKFRNQVTHEGSVLDVNTKIILVDTMNNYGIDTALQSGDVIYLSLQQFCEKMYSAAEFTLTCTSKNVSQYPFVCVPQEAYKEIRGIIESEFQDYWDKREDGLKWYNFFAEQYHGQVERAEKALSSNGSLWGLSPEDSIQVLEIIKQAQSFGDKINAHIARKYFSEDSLSQI